LKETTQTSVGYTTRIRVMNSIPMQAKKKSIAAKICAGSPEERISCDLEAQRKSDHFIIKV
jgi:hypothetical protein